MESGSWVEVGKPRANEFCWCQSGVSFGADECRRDQRRLQTRTLPVTYVRVRGKAVGGVVLVFGVLDGEVGMVGLGFVGW